MKKILIAAAFYGGFAMLAAQTAAPENDKDLKTWYHKDHSSTKVYGVNTENAYKFFESKGFQIITPEDILQNLTPKSGILTLNSPSQEEFEDIAKGSRILALMNIFLNSASSSLISS